MEYGTKTAPRLAAAQRLAGIASNNPLTLAEIKTGRLARQ